ncbi:hypothetical protein ACFWNL_17570 [Kitasatospora sp. NPDC058397]|uniref:hypothetical protein n=1 Tax=unclassified Kitasatospora TaxID=2633591 RepID=UPI00364C2141
MDPGEPAVPNDGGHDPQCTNAHPSVQFAIGHGPDRREVTTSACILGTADLFTTSTD